jgi:hypothetical protein
MKLRQVGAELFHTDKETDMKKLIVAFHKFAKAPNINEAKSSNKSTLERP